MSILVGNPFFLDAGAGANEYQISRSLRFNSSDSAYLSRVTASAGNRRVYTWSGWVKRNALSSTLTYYLFSAQEGANANNVDIIGFEGDNLYWYNAFSGNVDSQAELRDPSAWYHILVAVDTTQATNTNRVKLYVNGSEIAYRNQLYPSLNRDLATNSNNTTHQIGRYTTASDSNFCLADIHFIDGQALTPSSFTEVSATTGQLIPKAYTDVLPGPVTLVPSIAEGALIIKADAATITGSVTAAGFVKVHSSSDGINWTYREQILSGALSFSAKYIAIGGGSTNSRTFNPSTGGSYTWAEYSAGTQFDTTSNITQNVTGLSYTANSTVTAPFGTNGFWLKFSDNSAATATTLGKDYSGNSNNWTPNNLSVTAGAGNDSLVDTPTSYGTDTGAGGEVRGNYCTLNPLDTNSTLSNGNLDATTSASSYSATLGTIGLSSGKWYWENVYVSGNQIRGFGVATGNTARDEYLGQATSWGYMYTGVKVSPGNIQSSYGNSWTTGDVIGVAFDADAGNLYFYKNGVAQNSGTAAFTSLTSGPYFPIVTNQNTSSASGVATANFGQRPFAYTAPSGFKALCDTNLPAPVVAKPPTVMDVKLYTGNGSTQTISGLGFSPDLVWIKGRSTAYWHRVYDTIRGATKPLYTNLTDAEATDITELTAFNSDGFDLGGSVGANNISDTYAAWCWDAGSSTVTNTQGSITSQVRANTSAGFSIVTYTGNGTAGATVGHGLGVAPSLIIVKNRSVSAHWQVGHASFGWSGGAYLSTTDAFSALTSFWNNTAPGSSVFTLGTLNYGNGNGNSMVAYCFAPVANYSAFGSYTGNGSTDGPFVYTGFRPRWVILKNASAVWNWQLRDTARDTYNPAQARLFPNTSDAESTNDPVDILANGFKIRVTGGDYNGNGNTFIWAAFAENPFQYARAR